MFRVVEGKLVEVDPQIVIHKSQIVAAAQQLANLICPHGSDEDRVVAACDAMMVLTDLFDPTPEL